MKFVRQKANKCKSLLIQNTSNLTNSQTKSSKQLNLFTMSLTNTTRIAQLRRPASVHRKAGQQNLIISCLSSCQISLCAWRIINQKRRSISEFSKHSHAFKKRNDRFLNCTSALDEHGGDLLSTLLSKYRQYKPIKSLKFTRNLDFKHFTNSSWHVASTIFCRSDWSLVDWLQLPSTSLTPIYNKVSLFLWHCFLISVPNKSQDINKLQSYLGAGRTLSPCHADHVVLIFKNCAPPCFQH
jgi:hypothetical protein